MVTRATVALAPGLVVTCLAAAASRPGTPARSVTSLAPATMARIGTVDERYQSYNVEMVEVTGGRFWKPYTAKPEASPTSTPASPPSGSDAPAGLSRDLFQYRPPIDLRSARMRKLAAGLGPAYMRVSGTWANTTYFPESDKAPDAPPDGYRGVLTRQQWKGVVDFSRAVDAPLVTSFATGAGTRDAAGVWTPDQARRLLEYTKSIAGRVQVVAHNTLVASDYGLLDEDDFTPKPSYWGGLLWRKLMGTTVLDSGVALRAGLHAYAHCLRGAPGGVALLVINTDKAASQTLALPTTAERYTLTSTNPLSRQVQLNGKDLTLGSNDDLPRLAGVPIAAGDLTLAPATITFLAVPAANGACR